MQGQDRRSSRKTGGWFEYGEIKSERVGGKVEFFASVSKLLQAKQSERNSISWAGCRIVG